MNIFKTHYSNCEEPSEVRGFLKVSDVVRCEDCKCLLSKGDANSVRVETFWQVELYYCGQHKKPYTRKNFEGRYYGEVEMTEDGKPIIKK